MQNLIIIRGKYVDVFSKDNCPLFVSTQMWVSIGNVQLGYKKRQE